MNLKKQRKAIPFNRSVAIFILAIGVSNPLFSYAEDAKDNQNSQMLPIQDTPKANKISQAALAQGVISCIPRINQVTSYVGYTDNLGAFLMAPTNQQDHRLIPIVMEIPTDSGPAYVSAEFAPNQANGCGATYDAVIYWPERCDLISSKQFNGLKTSGILTKEIIILSSGLNTKVFLMPAGSGCISIKKELVN